MTRKWTRLLFDAMEGGTVSPQAVADMALAYMSEDDVEEMCRQNDLMVLDPSYDEDDEDDEEFQASGTTCAHAEEDE